MRRLASMLVLTSLLAVPGGGAQVPLEPTIELVVQTTDPTPLMPETSESHAVLEARISCSSEQPGTAANTAMFSVGAVPPWARVVLNPSATSSTINPQDCVDSTYRKKLQFEAIITVSRDAPAFYQLAIPVAVKVKASKEYGPVQAQVPITIDYLGLFVANPHALYQQVPPDSEFAFPVEVQNLGNGAARFTFTTEAAGRSGYARLDAPEPLVLESRTQNGSEAHFKTIVLMGGRTAPSSGYENYITRFDGKIESVSAQDPQSFRDTQTIAFAVQVQSGSASDFVPGPSLAVAILAIVLVVLVHRRP